jgi:putative ABC transport system ATP-binding protein
MSKNERYVIETDRLEKTYRSGDEVVHALRGVTLGVERGAFTFIVGPSGSGKSTLLYLLAMLDQPTSGAIWIDGESVTSMPEGSQDAYRRNKIGFIFQQFNLIQNLSAIENVLLPFIPAHLSAEIEERAARLLAQVGLGNRKGHKPKQLSGGQQQRVAIARALVTGPKILLADEPTGNLDRKGGDEIFELLREQQRISAATLMVVTHDRRFIREGDRVVEIQDGELLSDHT